jgi:hypothetical protein
MSVGKMCVNMKILFFSLLKLIAAYARERKINFPIFFSREKFPSSTTLERLFSFIYWGSGKCL